MDKLFIFMLGGKHPRARIEVHDIVPAIASDYRDAFPWLRRHWFGDLAGAHIDGWICLDGLEGYRLEFATAAPAADAPRLYLINLGGYLADQFGEQHQYIPVVAHSAAEAKRKGKEQAERAWLKPHADAVIDIDDCLLIDQVDGRHIHLLPGAHTPPAWTNHYELLES
jgi:Domain of Unknown Function (DUF1543).